MAEILVRGLTPQAVKQLDRLTKEKGYPSRNAYVKSLLEDMTFLEKNAALYERLEKQLVANSFFMEQTDNSLKKVLVLLEGLIMDDDTSDRT